MPLLSPATVGCDLGAAFGAAFCVAPFIAIIDQAIVQNASATATLVGSLQSSVKTLLRHPGVFLTRPAFLMLWGVYGGTYVAVNTVTSVADAAQASAQQRSTAKFTVISSVNIGLNVSKDRVFAKMFGQGTPRPVPLKTIGVRIPALRLPCSEADTRRRRLGGSALDCATR